MSLSSNVNQAAGPYSPCSQKVGARWVGRNKRRVATPTAATVHHLDSLIGLHEICDPHIIFVVYDRTGRNGQYEILTGLAVAELTRTVGTLVGHVMRVALIGQQRRHLGLGFDDDVAAVSTGATCRLAARTSTMFQEGNDSGTAIAGTQPDPDSIDEHSTRSWAPSPLFGENADESTAVAFVVLHLARAHRKQRVIAPAADVLSSVDSGAALAHDDGSSGDLLAIEDLRTEPLRS